MKSTYTHIAKYNLSTYGSEQFICANHRLDSEKVLFLVFSKNIALMGSCIFKHSFNICQDANFLLVRLTQLSIRVTLADMPGYVTSLYKTLSNSLSSQPKGKPVF